MLTRGSDEDEAALRDSVEGRGKLGRLLWLECLLSAAESPRIGSRPFLLILRELIREGEGSLEDRCGNAVRATETWLARRREAR